MARFVLASCPMTVEVQRPVSLGAFCRTLFQKDGALRMRELELAMARAMARSFKDDRHPMRRPTNVEIKRRTGIMMGWIRELLDGGWCVVRVCDHLDAILDTELDGARWVPPERTIWMPQETA